MASKNLICNVCVHFAEELEERLDAEFVKLIETLTTSVETLNKTVSNHDIPIRKIETKAMTLNSISENSLRFYGLKT
ncbi:hypothetical protein JTB14_031991 [Gonioctena quinquepunctata]|nr:hypothetical protein JTB14_031991 [Gonioctena quinquepunctata]